MFDSFKTQKTNKEIVREVYDALVEREYNPVDQLVGYLVSGDPSYITSYNNARSLIKGIDRDELVAEMGDIIGKECAAVGVRQILTPVVNIADISFVD